MKYIFDHRYKTIHTLVLYLSSLNRICQLGQSEMLDTTMEEIRKQSDSLEAMKSAPFNEEEIEIVSLIQSHVMHILHLPEDILPTIQSTVQKAKILLYRIDPFTTGFEESIGVRKSLLVELIGEIRMFLKASDLDLEKIAPSIVEERSMIHKVMKEIVLIPYHDFDEDEKKGLVQLLASFEAYKDRPTVDLAKVFFAKAVEVESLLRGEGNPDFNDLNALLDFLYETLLVAEKAMTLDANQFPHFKEILKASPVQKSVMRVSEVRFQSQELEEIKETLFLAYRNLLLEPGDTLTSRTRAIELFRVFGHEVIALRIQSNQPPKDEDD